MQIKKFQIENKSGNVGKFLNHKNKEDIIVNN